ncbi:MAG: hypothetical protein IJ408_04700 [Clostridia bacterium]|nr:hypothetical protein [Clostridia bacterium]
MENVFKKYLSGSLHLDIKAFKNPPSELFPTYSWLWTGSITKEGIKTRLTDMKRAGIRSFYILPLPDDFSPGGMATTLSPEYLSAEFFKLVRFTAQYAKQNGMSMWLYDEGGWPSGNACEKVVKKAPELSAKKLVRTENGYELQIRYYPYTLEKKPHYADSASEEANDIFLDLTYEPYKRETGELFGTFLPLMFTDEPAIRFPALPSGAAELYRSKYGADISECFPAVFEEVENPELRIRYCETVSEIFRKNYFEKIHGWCRQNGILFAGHLNMDNTLQGCHMNCYGSQIETLRCFDIPGIDVIWRQIYPFFDKKPTTAEFDGVTDFSFFPRLASSAASQNGTNLAVTESFAIYGHGLTADIMRYVSNYQLVRGINLFNVMTVPYEMEGNIPFTGAPQFMPFRPDYTHLTKINEYLARVSYLALVGRREVKTALFAPYEDCYAGGKREKNALESFERAGRYLEKHFVDFDIIDSRSIETAKALDGKLKIGAAEYESVIVPEGVSLSDSLREKLKTVSSDILPILDCDCDGIRVMKRVLPCGSPLYFLFNEKTDAVTVSITLPDITDVCAFDPSDGSICKADLDNLSLQSGELLVLTGNVHGAKEKPIYQRKISLTGFEKTPIEKTLLSKDGISKTEKDLLLSEDFSGRVEYKLTFELEKAPQTAALCFESLSYSADVSINGKPAGIISMPPYTLDIPQGILKAGENELIITVANTLSNVYNSFDPEKYFDKRFLGSYNSKQRAFEKDTMDLPSFSGATLKISEV